MQLKAETSAGTTHAAYENALLEYSGLNEQACESFQFNLTPGNSPMKFKQDSELYSHQQPRIVVPQLSHHAGATATAPRIPNGANGRLCSCHRAGRALDCCTAGQQVVGSALTKEEEFSDDDLGVNPAAAGLTVRASAFSCQLLVSSNAVLTTCRACLYQVGVLKQMRKQTRKTTRLVSGGSTRIKFPRWPLNSVCERIFWLTAARTYTLDREQSLMLLNKPGGVATEEELNEIDPSLLTPEETKK